MCSSEFNLQGTIMNYLPSKELLTEILKENVKEVYEIGSNPNFKDNTLLFNLNGCGELCNINIYELAQKCKEWAYKQGYVILSGHSAYGIGAFFCSCKGWLSENYDKRIEINHNTEPEAIFVACQWIIDNRS